METLKHWGPTLALVIIGLLFWRADVDRAKTLADLKAGIENSNQRIAAGQKQTDAGKAAVDQQVAGAVTMPQLMTLLGQWTGMKQPPTIIPIGVPQPAPTGAPAGSQTPAGGTLPDHPSPQPSPGAVGQLNQEQAQALVQTLAACRKDALDLQQCQQVTVPELKGQVKKADEAAKGGSRLTKVKKGLKCIAAAGAGAGLGAALANTKGAMIGGAAGAGLCHIAF